MIIARLSDIFGRKAALVAVVIIFAVANLICGFAKNAVMLYIFRAFSGIGAGGVRLFALCLSKLKHSQINGLSMIIVSDIVSIRERGKYQVHLFPGLIKTR